MDVNTTSVDIATHDGTADALLAAPVDGGPHPGVLLYMDAFGLRPRLQEMAQRLAGAGYVVLVPNVFYRAGRAPVVEIGDLTDPAVRTAMFAELGPLMQALTPERVARDAEAYVGFLTARDEVGDAPMGTLGYCMGGALALRTGAQLPDRIAAIASFHGGKLATDDADSPHRLVARLRGEVYVAHADRDGSMPPEQQQRLAAALESAGVTHRTELYDGAAHGFTMSDTAVYDEAATQRHWDSLLDLLGRTLRP